jgi:hypothetical protein
MQSPNGIDLKLRQHRFADKTAPLAYLDTTAIASSSKRHPAHPRHGPLRCTCIPRPP